MKLCIKCNNEKDGNHPSYCKSCNSKRVVEWKKKNRDKYNEYSRQLAKAMSEKDYLSYRDSRNKSNRSWVEKNKEKIRKQKKEYQQNNPHKAREADRRRRALKKENIHEPYSEKQVLEKYGTACHICKEEIDLSANRASGSPGWQQGLHLDHVVPLSKGGPDTIDNVKPAHGLCNLQKNDSID